MLSSQIDTHTFLLILCIGNFITLGLFYFYAHHIKGDSLNSFFFVGKLLQGLSWGLIILGASIPRVFSFQIANNLMPLGIAMDAAALASEP
jgi:hypothetical protein